MTAQVAQLTEAAQVALLTQLGGILIAVIGVLGSIGLFLLESTRRHAKATRRQAENDHDTNLRDDIDIIVAGMATVVREQKRQGRVQKHHTDQLRQLTDETARLDAELEDTREHLHKE